MFTKQQHHPEGLSLTRRLEQIDAENSIRLHGTWISGEPVRGPMSPTTTKWTVLRLFVYRKSGLGVWFLEYWEHDNGCRAEFQQISAGEARALITPAVI